jgi:hypothetical protein
MIYTLCPASYYQYRAWQLRSLSAALTPQRRFTSSGEIEATGQPPGSRHILCSARCCWLLARCCFRACGCCGGGRCRVSVARSGGRPEPAATSAGSSHPSPLCSPLRAAAAAAAAEADIVLALWCPHAHTTAPSWSRLRGFWAAAAARWLICVGRREPGQTPLEDDDV